MSQTRPDALKGKWAQVQVIDLEYQEEYSFWAEHVVLNIPATVREARPNVLLTKLYLGIILK